MAKPKLAPVTTPPKPEVAEAPPPPKSKKSKLILIAVLVLLLLAGGGGGAGYYFLGRHAAEDKPEPKAEKKALPTFVTLDAFTVNLLEETGDHYLQVGLVYQVPDSKAVDVMKAYMPIIRNKVLLVLSSKRPSEISSPEGKQQLVAELVAAARAVLPGESAERGVDGAFLSSFVIQ